MVRPVLPALGCKLGLVMRVGLLVILIVAVSLVDSSALGWGHGLHLVCILALLQIWWNYFARGIALNRHIAAGMGALQLKEPSVLV